jgi:hypothetical protein
MLAIYRVYIYDYCRLYILYYTPRFKKFEESNCEQSEHKKLEQQLFVTVLFVKRRRCFVCSAVVYKQIPLRHDNNKKVSQLRYQSNHVVMYIHTVNISSQQVLNLPSLPKRR